MQLLSPLHFITGRSLVSYQYVDFTLLTLAPALPSSLELRGLLHVTEQLNEAKQAAILVCLPVLSCLDVFILTCKLTNVSSFPSQPSPFSSLCPFNAFSLKFLRGESLEKIQEVRHLLSITKENKLV